VFTLVDGEWESLGKDINGEKNNDFSGSALTLSSDGRILAIGATLNNGIADDDFDERGHVRVFKLNNKNKWKPLGNDIDGESLGDNSGSSVSLSADGKILAIGAPLNDGSADNRYDERGHVRVFRLNEKDQWDPVGIDIDGDSKDDEMGSSVSLSSDGLTLAVGVSFDDDSGENTRFVRVLKFSSTSPVGSTKKPKRTKKPKKPKKSKPKKTKKPKTMGPTLCDPLSGFSMYPSLARDIKSDTKKRRGKKIPVKCENLTPTIDIVLLP